MNGLIQDEFGRQAAPMASAPAFTEARGLTNLLAALGAPPLGRILDVACGPGIVAEAIAPYASKVVGVDATPEMAAQAEARLHKAGFTNAFFRIAQAEHLPFGPAEFDAAVTRLSFHHFPNLPAILAEIRRVLRPTGRLVVADVVTSPDPEKAALHNTLEQLRDPTHVRMLTRPELLSTLRIGGFAPRSEQSWEQKRSFAEWSKIVAAPERMCPLRQIMLALARAGQDAGIQLHETEGDLQFTHTWLLVVAELVPAADM